MYLLKVFDVEFLEGSIIAVIYLFNFQIKFSAALLYLLEVLKKT